MPKPTKSEIKAVLSAAEKANRAAALKDRRAPERDRLKAHQKEVQKLVKSHLKKTGFDLAALQKIQTQTRKDMLHLFQRKKAVLRPPFTGQPHDWPPLPPLNIFVLKTPLLILADTGIELLDSQIMENNNTAKIEGRWINDGPRTTWGTSMLRFIFLWENPSDQLAAVNVWSELSVNGLLEAFGSQGFFDGGGGVTLQAYATLQMWNWWEDPKTSFFSPPQYMPYVQARGGFWGSDLESESVEGRYQSTYNFFWIPKSAFTVIEMDLAFNSSVYSGYAQADFSTVCPALTLQVLTEIA